VASPIFCSSLARSAAEAHGVTDRSYAFEGTVWRWPGGNWFFVTLPFDIADEIDDTGSAARVGFGSVRVEVTIGSSTWQTSLFPDKKAASFLLPVKQAIRRAERLDDGDAVRVGLRVPAG
jgi:hypothetical protein